MGKETFSAVEMGRNVGNNHQFSSLTLSAGGQDPLDGPIGRVADGECPRTSRLEAGAVCLSARPSTP